MPSSTVNPILLGKTTACGYQKKLGGDYCEIVKVGNGEVALKLNLTAQSYMDIAEKRTRSSSEAHFVNGKGVDDN